MGRKTVWERKDDVSPSDFYKLKAGEELIKEENIEFA